MRAPVFILYGSFFPAWIFAALAGIVIAAILRQVLVLIDRDVPFAVAFYPAIAALIGIALYQYWTGGLFA